MVENKKGEKLIQIISIAVPLLVAVILGMRSKIDLGLWTKQLPHVIGVINGTTSVLLILGFFFIKRKNFLLHKVMMLSAFGLGAVFLILYIAYHISNNNTPSTGMAPFERCLYLFLLITHILLSVVVVRFVLLAIYFALTNQIFRHKQIVKWTFPLWLYVSTSGVFVYLMISPYYK